MSSLLLAFACAEEVPLWKQVSGGTAPPLFCIVVTWVKSSNPAGGASGNGRKWKTQIARKVPSPLAFWQTTVHVLNGLEEEGGELQPRPLAGVHRSAPESFPHRRGD